MYLSPRVPPHSVRLALGYVRFAFALSGRTMRGVSFPRVLPHSVRLALGYVCFAFALSGRLLVIGVFIVNVYDGLKAQ